MTKMYYNNDANQNYLNGIGFTMTKCSMTVKNKTNVMRIKSKIKHEYQIIKYNN